MAPVTNYDGLARDIVAALGGPDNLTSMTHCSTRLRFTVRDDEAADIQSVKQLKGVLGVVTAGGQTQVVMGPTVGATYEAVHRQFTIGAAGASTSAADRTSVSGTSASSTATAAGTGASDTASSASPRGVWKRAGRGVSVLVNYIAASVTPMIPGLIAGGMLKVGLLLAGLISPGFAESSTHEILGIVANVPFYFMPIWIAYGAALKLNATPMYPMVVAAATFAPTFMEWVEASPQTPHTLIGLPVPLLDYSGSLMPALMIAFTSAYVERFWNRVIPTILKTILSGVLTLLCTYILTMLVLAPIGTWLGNGLVTALMGIHSVAGPVAPAILGGLMPFVVMAGAHHVFVPFMVQLLGNPGYDTLFRPSMLLHNMAEGGACLGIFLRAKDKQLKSEVLSVALGCLLAGVTEPAIYGYNLPLRQPLKAVSAGGAAGGLVADLLGARAYVMGYSNLFALPIFQATILAAVAGVVTAVIVSCVVTVILGFDESLVVARDKA